MQKVTTDLRDIRSRLAENGERLPSYGQNLLTARGVRRRIVVVLNGHRQLVSRVSRMPVLAVGIGVYCQPTLQISAQTRNFWVLEALCWAAVT
jgi:hypothetical protein